MYAHLVKQLKPFSGCWEDIYCRLKQLLDKNRDNKYTIVGC